MGDWFTMIRLPALTQVYVCRKCAVLVAPMVDGEDGARLHRRNHGSVDSSATIAHPGDPRAQ